MNFRLWLRFIISNFLLSIIIQMSLEIFTTARSVKAAKLHSFLLRNY